MWRHCLRQKKVDLRTFRRQEKCFKCVIIHERARNVYMYLNNVLSCCAHIICIMEKIGWARILDMCRYRILFYFRIRCQLLKINVDFRGKKRMVVPDPLHPSALSVRFHKC